MDVSVISRYLSASIRLKTKGMNQMNLYIDQKNTSKQRH